MFFGPGGFSARTFVFVNILTYICSVSIASLDFRLYVCRFGILRWGHEVESVVLAGGVFLFWVMFSGIIYLRISPSNKGYVGQTIDEAGRDWEFGNLNKRYGGAAIEAARRKYPPSLWRNVVVCTVSARNRAELRIWLDALEVYYIWAYRTADKRYGYNAKLGGNSRGGYRHSEETLRKIGDGNKGKVISPEARAMISSKLRGRKRPLSACVKTSLAMRGHVWSPETLAKRASAKLGYRLSNILFNNHILPFSCSVFDLIPEFSEYHSGGSHSLYWWPLHDTTSRLRCLHALHSLYASKLM